MSCNLWPPRVVKASCGEYLTPHIHNTGVFTFWACSVLICCRVALCFVASLLLCSTSACKAVISWEWAAFTWSRVAVDCCSCSKRRDFSWRGVCVYILLCDSATVKSIMGT